MTETTVTSKGQVTIPRALRDRLGLRAGAKVVFSLDETGRAYLKPAKPVKTAASRFEKMRGTATAGLSTEAIMALTRGRR